MGGSAANGAEQAHLATAIHVRQHVEVLAQCLAPHARVDPSVLLQTEQNRAARETITASEVQPSYSTPLLYPPQGSSPAGNTWYQSQPHSLQVQVVVAKKAAFGTSPSHSKGTLAGIQSLAIPSRQLTEACSGHGGTNPAKLWGDIQKKPARANCVYQSHCTVQLTECLTCAQVQDGLHAE